MHNTLYVITLLCTHFHVQALSNSVLNDTNHPYSCPLPPYLPDYLQLESLREARVASIHNGHLAIKEDPMDLDLVERSWSEGSVSSGVGTGIGVHATSDGDAIVDRNGPSNLESGRSVQNVLHNGDGDIEDVTRSD